KSRADIARAAADLRAMMEAGAPAPAGDWAGLKILEPVIGYKSRHDTVLLPFAAVEMAFAEKD
ncbi:MAG: iron-sulfur cluster assembly scaffold protein, partial [Alphaproteobacteria bacterium]|nr:iron-sulfur cluster assembly scaffold protein [Alphaproteobacteria bacterium]